ncbi:MAG: hypothetical protein ABIG84_07665 [archaeon]
MNSLYIRSIAEHGTYAITEAFDAWKEETQQQDHESIPKRDIILEFYKMHKNIAPP